MTSGLEKVNAAVMRLVGLAGAESMLVSGAPRSKVQVYEAGVGSVLLNESTARTSKVCVPSASGPNVLPELHAEYPPPSS